MIIAYDMVKRNKKWKQHRISHKMECTALSEFYNPYFYDVLNAKTIKELDLLKDKLKVILIVLHPGYSVDLLEVEYNGITVTLID